MAYQIFTEATADLISDLPEGLPKIEIIPMHVEINDQEYTYGPNGNLTAPLFYDLQRQGYFASTSQINPYTYFSSFDEALRKGLDVLYLGFSSALSGCMQAVQVVVDTLKTLYPEQKIICVDTLCASAGEGFLVLEAAQRQAGGMEIQELAQWVEQNRLRICHWFTVDTFDHLKHGGRVSAASAVVGTMLAIKPMLHVDDIGRLEVVDKPRGRKNAMNALLKRMEMGWVPKWGRRVIIAHGDDLDKAKLLQNAVAEKFPDAEIQLAYIGPVIGTHTGPGMLAVLYWGNNR